MAPRRLVALLAGGLTLAACGTAAAAERVVRDAQGRPIIFDVRADNVDVAGYARILRNAIHGNEISRVRVVVVPASRVSAACGAPADGCYDGRRIVVPAARPSAVAHVLLHEYAHHLDRSRPNGRRPEPNGTPRWWSARRLSQRLAQGLVALDYSRGWSRSVGEIFAEDYVQLHLRSSHAIGWLRPPSTSVLRALRRDLTGSPTGGPRPVTPEGPSAPPRPDPPPDGPAGGDDPAADRPPLVITRSGVILGGETRSLPFGLLGPGRRVRLEGALEPLVPGAAARAQVVCDGAVVGSADPGASGALDLDLRGLGPASCELRLQVTADTAYDLRLTLSLT